MNIRNALAVVPVVALLALGGCAAPMAAQPQDKQPAMASETSMAPQTSMATESPMATKDDMMKAGAYVTLADYQQSMSMYADTTVVYFFHASWCPTCKADEATLTASPSPVPQGVTVVKVDYDTATELKQRYGVTMQHTYVQIDKSGNAVMTWKGKPASTVLADVAA